jgi:hypothetical protein
LKILKNFIKINFEKLKRNLPVTAKFDENDKFFDVFDKLPEKKKF